MLDFSSDWYRPGVLTRKNASRFGHTNAMTNTDLSVVPLSPVSAVCLLGCFMCLTMFVPWLSGLHRMDMSSYDSFPRTP